MRSTGDETQTPAEAIGEWELWEVYDGGETFWMAAKRGESAIALLADEHGLAMDDMTNAEQSRVSIGDAMTKTIGDEDRPGVYTPLGEAFRSLVAEIEAGRSATRCVGATVW